MNSFWDELLGAANVVDVVGIAAVNQDVATLEMGQQIGDGVVYRAGRHHQPNGAWLCELLGELRQRSRADGLFLHQLRHRLCRPIEHDALMAALQQAAHHIPAHPAEADHSELHGLALHGGSMFRSDLARVGRGM